MANLCNYMYERRAKKVEEMKYLSKIGATIMSPPRRKNIIVQSPTGSGKSTALTTATLQRVDRELECPQVICVVPTRESAIQNMDLLLEMGKHNPVTSDLGVPPSKADYIPLLRKPPVEAQVIVGTPVTIHKWIVAKKLDIGGMKMLLIDDADRVLAEPGFKDCVVRIMQNISKKRPQCQVIICFTISSDDVEAFVSKIKVLSENEFLSFTGEILDSVKQYKVNVLDEPSKVMVIIRKLLYRIDGQTIVFVNTIGSARMLVEGLETNRFMCKTLDGDDTQEQRDKILEEFKEKEFQVLISTKILDPSQVGLVVFYGLSIISGSSPEADLEQYSRCIGRAGQFGRKGAVFNLMCGDKDKKIMENIETLNNVTEVLLDDDVQFKDALIEAGLLPLEHIYT